MKKTISIILVFCFMISNGILTYAKNTDENSTEICVGQIIEKYSINNIGTLYMSRNVKGYTEQITIKEKEEISNFLKELYNLKLTTNINVDGNIKINLWRNATPGTVTIYSSAKGLSDKDISYYIDLKDVDRIIENMNLHWVENKAGGPGYFVADVAPKENSETLTVNNVLGAPEYYDYQYLKFEKLNNTNTKETVTCKDISKIKKFYQLFLDLPIFEKNDGDNIYIELISNDNKYIYSSDDGLSVQDKIYYIRESDVLDCLSQSDITQWYSLPVVDKNESLITPNDSKELSKIYEMDILNKNGIIVGDPDGNLRESDEITRAEFTAVLCRAMGCENETENDDLKRKNYFPDVPAEHWASGYINFAYENGAINGFTDGKFYPEEKVTNEQAVKMLIGAWGYGDEAEQNGGYPDGYLKIAKENGIFNAIEFDNKNASKRWVASVFVYGVLSMPSKNPAVNPPIKTVPISFENIRNENDSDG